MDNAVFNFEGYNVRMLEVDDKPYFVGKDVTTVLGYKNGSRDLNRHVDEEDKIKGVIPQYQNGTLVSETILINESGLYSLIMNSNLPNSKKFRRWVTNEVLPSIRKRGGYLTEKTTEQVLQDPDFIIAMATELKAERAAKEKLETENIAMKPKALFADSVAASDTSILIRELAVMLKQNGVNIGQQRLFEWLRYNGYLIKRKGDGYNMPTQKSMDLALFEIKQGTRSNADGIIKLTKTAKVTGKGQQYFINKLLKTEVG